MDASWDGRVSSKIFDTLTSDLVFSLSAVAVRSSLCPVHISYILEIGIPNLVCGCIFGWRSVAYQFLVTVTLTSDQVLE